MESKSSADYFPLGGVSIGINGTTLFVGTNTDNKGGPGYLISMKTNGFNVTLLRKTAVQNGYEVTGVWPVGASVYATLFGNNVYLAKYDIATLTLQQQLSLAPDTFSGVYNPVAGNICFAGATITCVDIP
eukprot:TRINITY_DN13447_c0_g1_i1.p1 TRINITY_DN13447_c0_g1~~TRINITY_DN13447_c0_g1_i1.p1  ORF type:complete len:130 (-),score=14.02 TRINITY_DN13447_c0_g1_i1:48-437(-)